MKVTLLGCGASWGVPAIGPDWGRCDPADPRNRRRRGSLLVESGGAALLIDTAPDLRQQLLDAGVSHIDAVLLTHAHADHLHGIDDLRMVSQLAGHAIPFYAGDVALAEADRRFGYAFKPVTPGRPVYRPALTPHRIDGPFTAAGMPVVPFVQSHGYSTTLGFRIGPVGYSTDVVELDDAAFAALAGVELWVVDCLRREPHPTHSNLEKTLRWIKRLGPRRAVLIHMDQSLDYRELAAELPPGVEPGQDGLVIELRTVIRVAEPQDREVVEAIVAAAYAIYVERIGKPPGPMLDDYAALIDAAAVRVWTEPDGVIAALIVLLPKPDHLLLDNIAVRPDRQGRGIGRRLIGFAESEAGRLGYAELRLYTHATMTENIALYRRLGFVETGRGQEAGYDRVFMTRRLDGG